MVGKRGCPTRLSSRLHSAGTLEVDDVLLGSEQPLDLQKHLRPLFSLSFQQIHQSPKPFLCNFHRWLWSRKCWEGRRYDAVGDVNVTQCWALRGCTKDLIVENVFNVDRRGWLRWSRREGDLQDVRVVTLSDRLSSNVR